MRGLCLSLLLLLLIRVPFDFRAGGAHFGPGEYVIELDGTSATIRSKGSGHRATVGLRRSSGDAGPSTVSFRTYGDSRYLAAIQPESGVRWEIAASAGEAALARTQGHPKLTHLRADAVVKE